MRWTGGNFNAMVIWMLTAITTYPNYKEPVQKLVEQHRKLRDEHLHLAVYFSPPNRPKQDIYLFEVIHDFGGGHIDPDKKLFSFGYGSTPGFPLPAGVSLRMVLTNPDELKTAIEENWKRVGELRKARNAKRAIVIYADATGKKFWNRIK
jgi:hypothetical protein